MQNEATDESIGNSLDVIVRGAELPQQVLTRQFQKYLFFDADITSSKPMISAVREVAAACFDEELEVDVFARSSRSLLARLGGDADWPVDISRLGKALRDGGDVDGMILVDVKKRWVIYQSRPVDVGVFAIDSDRVPDGTEVVRDNFFNKEDISLWLLRRTARDVELVESFGAGFLATLLSNYSWTHKQGNSL
ncbi:MULTISPECIES: hypothetical protein [unclassified Variovorax]|uniref:hypothetical protein n=1 Tax=unclassified Variovorax TaxID=663243 RepID=UPI000838BE07|nr:MULTISPECIES: hypothetical protein [unclassified Variovorax]